MKNLIFMLLDQEQCSDMHGYMQENYTISLPFNISDQEVYTNALGTIL